MAKKKRRIPEEKEEKYEFVPPEFNEKEFLIKDLHVTKISWMVTILSIVMGVVAYFFSEMAAEMAVGFLILMVSLLGLRQLLSLMRFDMSEVDNKGMFGNYLLFTFLFLGVWIICMNSPVGDHSNPVIEDLSVGFESTSGYEFAVLEQNVYSLSGSGIITLNISAMVADNGQLDDVVIFWKGNGQSEFTEYNMTAMGNNMFQFEVNITAPTSGNPALNSNFRIVATDAAGNIKDTGLHVIRVSYSA